MRWGTALVLALCGIFISRASALAQSNPVQLSLFNPVQIVPENQSVSGLRLSLIYGVNANMNGFDWGLVTKTTGTFSGVQWGGVGLVNRDFTGWQANFVSITDGSFKGLQMSGIYSYADHVNGVQFSLVNSAGSMKGIQIGLLNFIKRGGFMPVFPIVNWGGL
ncbi:MAG: hypothetical protein H6Q30_2000 [Bacteroidetes bacterium]|nr:hypothetical protein [Bacteroidota bacterium]